MIRRAYQCLCQSGTALPECATGVHRRQRQSGHGDFKEADYLPALLQEDGLGERKLLIENQSRNTAENTSYSKALLPRTCWNCAPPARNG